MNTENRLIAEFMGWKSYVNDGAIQLYKKDNIVKALGQLDYNSDWGQLMKVAEKIESLDFIFDIYHGVAIIFNGETKSNGIYNEVFQGATKLQSVYIACVEFIKWYNLNK